MNRLHFIAFYETLLEAKDMHLCAGRSLSYATKFQLNGNLMAGKAYTAQLGPKPGDEFEIKLGRKQIKLIPLGAAEEE